jgi:hypothetical protein
MTTESSANIFACSSLVCSLSFWSGLMLSYVPAAPTLNVSGTRWFSILGVGIVLAVLSAVPNSEKKLWIPAIRRVSCDLFLCHVGDRVVILRGQK